MKLARHNFKWWKFRKDNLAGKGANISAVARYEENFYVK